MGGDRASQSTADSLQCDGAPDSGLTRQQLHQALGFDTHSCYLLHDRDSLLSGDSTPLSAAWGCVF